MSHSFYYNLKNYLFSSSNAPGVTQLIIFPYSERLCRLFRPLNRALLTLEIWFSDRSLENRKYLRTFESTISDTFIIRDRAGSLFIMGLNFYQSACIFILLIFYGMIGLLGEISNSELEMV